MLKDVFISYAREDVELAMLLARALTRNGYTVWWDDEIRAGEPFEEVIEKTLAASRCIVVLWTDHAYASSWVKREASAGAQRGMLLPLLLTDNLPPPEFSHVNAARITRIDSDLGKILREIEVKLGPKTYSLTRSIRLPKQKEAPTGIAVGEHAIWTSVFTGDLRAASYGYAGDISGKIIAINANTGEVTSTLGLDPGLRSIVFAFDSVWGLSETVARDGEARPIRRVDSGLTRVEAVIGVPCTVGKLVAGTNRMFGLCRDEKGTILSIDPAVNETVRSTQVGFKISDGVFGGDLLWLTGESRATALFEDSLQPARQTSWDFDELFPEIKDKRKANLFLTYDLESLSFRAVWGANTLWLGRKMYVWKINPDDLKILQKLELKRQELFSESGLQEIFSFVCYENVLWITGKTNALDDAALVVGVDLWSSTPSHPLSLPARYSPPRLGCGAGGVWLGSTDGLHEIERSAEEGSTSKF